MRTFTIVAESRAIACIIEETLKDAAAILSQDDLCAEPMLFESAGQPLWTGIVPIALRSASPTEAAQAQIAAAGYQVAKGEGPTEPGTMVFLVPVADPTEVVEDT